MFSDEQFYLSVPMLLAQVLSCLQLIFPSKSWFLGIYLNFQWQKSLLNQYLPDFESKPYQINSLESCSSRSFQQHQRHIPIPPKFSATIFNFQWKNHSIYKNFCTACPKSWNQAHAPLLIQSFPKTPRTWSKASWFNGSHRYKTNYLPL